MIIEWVEQHRQVPERADEQQAIDCVNTLKATSAQAYPEHIGAWKSDAGANASCNSLFARSYACPGRRDCSELGELRQNPSHLRGFHGPER